MEEQGKNIRIDTESEVQSYIGNFKYALEHGAQLTFQEEREVDRKRDIRVMRRYYKRNYSYAAVQQSVTAGFGG